VIRRLAGILPVPVQRWLKGARGRLRRVRVGRTATSVLGPRYRRSRTRVELDITWACNLRCFNCNRSCEQAPTGESMTLDQVRRFVDESLAAGQRWERIRVLGGEPTLHPAFGEILVELLRYRDAVPDVVIEVATHGLGDRVQAALARIPDGIVAEDTRKQGPEQPFSTFNVAPIDVPAYADADYTNGCAVTEVCGVGLTPHGYYPCAVAGGIDRIMGYDLARKRLPSPDDDQADQLAAFCRVCGHFKREHEEPVTSAVQSTTWAEAYERWRQTPRTRAAARPRRY
jgi:hypothetical protein